MKKILHISKYYFPFKGGTEQIAQDCVRSLGDTYEQKVICFNHEKGSVTDHIEDVEVIRCGCEAKISSQSISLSYGKLLKKVLREFQPDIVIFHYPNPYVAAFLLKLLPREAKLVIYWHLDIVKQKLLKQFFVAQNNQLIERANLLIATSEKYAEGSPYLKKAKAKCEVIPNCINVERFAMNDKVLRLAVDIRKKYQNKVICVSAGRLIPYKGFDYLIQASRKLDDRFEIFMIGKGEEDKKLKKMAEGDPKIHFLGSVDDNTLKAYFYSMDIFCFPSITKNEAFGLALAEGMYYGKPAVTFTILGSGVNYVCLNEEDGIEVPNRDANAYAEAMTRLADDPEMRRRMGENGRRRVNELFLNTQFGNNVRRVLQKLD